MDRRLTSALASPGALVALVPIALGSALFAGAVNLSSQSTGKSIAIVSHGGFYVGGRNVHLAALAPRERVSANPRATPPLNLNGDYATGATYVEYTKVLYPRVPYPLVMFPGGGLSGASYQDTPDGRPGWEYWFLTHGYSVDIVDVDSTGRSEWRAYPEIEPMEPSFRTNAFLWETFRIGRPGSYAQRLSYADSKFPVRAFAEFAKQAAPRFHPTAEQQAAAYDAVIRKVCPCILLLHSAAGPVGMAAAQRWPRLVKAVVAIEPSGGPDPSTIANRAPHIFIWGDHLSPVETEPGWNDDHRKSLAYAKRLQAAGTRIVWIDLPARGIQGNSHLLMMDRNSDEIAGLIDRALSQTLKASHKRVRKGR